MIGHVKAWLHLTGDRRAVTALEYGLIAALIGLTIVGAVTTLGTNISTTFNTISTKLSSGASK